MGRFVVTYKDEPLHGWRRVGAATLLIAMVTAMIFVTLFAIALAILLTPVAALWWLVTGSWPKWHQVSWR